MKSKTVKFNVYQLLITILLLCGTFVNNTSIPHWLYMVLAIGGMIVSQGITYFTPSGEFVGHGENWSVAKWITRIGLSLIAIFELANNAFGAVYVISILSPIIEIIIRIYGSDTQEQQSAAKGY